MTKNFYILDEPDLPTYRNHRFFVEKFANGFSLYGFNVEVVSSVDKIKEGSIVMISNHGFETIRSLTSTLGGFKFFNKFKRKKVTSFTYRFIREISSLVDFRAWFVKFERPRYYLRATKVLEKVSKIKNIVVICWFYQNYVDLLEDLGIQYILTGEHYYAEPYYELNKRLYEIYKTNDRALPIKFSASVDPEKVGENCVNRAITLCYIGSRSYKPEYYRLFDKHRDCRIVPTPPYIAEEERINIYRNSMISLGLHSPENIRNNCVGERVFESLAYGALCLTDNPIATKVTNGISVLIKDRDHLMQLVEHYVNNEEERLALREKGFKFIRSQGTYKHMAREFINLAKKLYDYEL